MTRAQFLPKLESNFKKGHDSRLCEDWCARVALETSRGRKVPIEKLYMRGMRLNFVGGSA